MPENRNSREARSLFLTSHETNTNNDGVIYLKLGMCDDAVFWDYGVRVMPEFLGVGL